MSERGGVRVEVLDDGGGDALFIEEAVDGGEIDEVRHVGDTCYPLM